MRGRLVLLAALTLLPAPLAAAPGDVVLEWYGGAFVRLVSPEGVRVVIDPSRQAGRPVPEVEADVVAISHEHPDHNRADAVAGRPVILRGLKERGKGWQPIRFRDRDVSITSVPVTLTGMNNLLLVDAAGLRVAHLSDLDHIPSDQQLQMLGRVDVAFVPLAGKPSLDGGLARQVVTMIKPRVAIPMHYTAERPEAGPPEPERAFVEGATRVRRIAAPRVVLNRRTLPVQTELWILAAPR